MKNLKALVTFLMENYGSAVALPKNGAKGINIFADIASDLDKITRLSKSAGLSVIYNDAEYDRGRLVSPSRSYIGKVDRKQATKDDIVNNLTF